MTGIARSALHHSFDIFDTCLTRTFADPDDLLLDWAQHFASELETGASPAEIFSQRLQAESHARGAAPAGECTIAEIYATLAKPLALGTAMQHRALALELELQRKALRAIPLTRARIDQLRREGRSVSFISDTYFPSSFLAEVLRHHGLFEAGDRIYASCEYRATKASGALFDIVRQHENIVAAAWRHVGDSELADVRAAKQRGIEAEHFSHGLLLPRERALRNSIPALRLACSRVAAAARLARLQKLSESRHTTTIRDTSTAVLGPLLCSFVLWCLDRAHALRLRRLYFVSRDGQILVRLADILRPWAAHADVECRYLYGSRQAWHLPALRQIDEVALDWMFERSRFLSVRGVLARVGLAPEEILLPLHQHGFSVFDRNLSHSERLRLRKIARDPTVTALIRTRASEARAAAIDYLRSEGVCDDVRAGVVDVGWTGRALSSLRKLVGPDKSDGREPTLVGLYFSLVKRSGAEAVRDEAFFFDVGKPSEHAWVARSAHLIELFMAADHGSVRGYIQSGSKAVPDIASNEPAALQWGVHEQQAAMLDFARALVASVPPPEFRTAAGALTRALCDFVHHPTREEAEAYGSFHFNDEQSGPTSVRELAPPIQPWRLIQCRAFGARLSDEHWVEGSIARSSALVRRLIRNKEPLRWRKHVSVRPLWLVHGMGMAKRLLPGRKERVAIFGASFGGMKTYCSLRWDQQAVFFVDNDIGKQGKRLLGLPVSAPHDLCDSSRFDRVLIGSAFGLQIYEQLRELGVPEDRIEIVSSEILKS